MADKILQDRWTSRFVCHITVTSQWGDGVSNHQSHDCLLDCLFGRRSKKTSKFRVTGLCVGNSPVTGEFPAQMASNAKNVFIWWRHCHMAAGESPTSTSHFIYFKERWIITWSQETFFCIWVILARLSHAPQTSHGRGMHSRSSSCFEW